MDEITCSTAKEEVMNREGSSMLENCCGTEIQLSGRKLQRDSERQTGMLTERQGSMKQLTMMEGICR